MTSPFEISEVFMVGYLRTPEAELKDESPARRLAWLYGQDKFKKISPEEQDDLRRRVEEFEHDQ